MPGLQKNVLSLHLDSHSKHQRHLVVRCFNFYLHVGCGWMLLQNQTDCRMSVVQTLIYQKTYFTCVVGYEEYLFRIVMAQHLRKTTFGHAHLENRESQQCCVFYYITHRRRTVMESRAQSCTEPPGIRLFISSLQKLIQYFPPHIQIRHVNGNIFEAQ